MRRFSVVVPVFKVEEYIANTITSLCNQIFRDFELIIVDDGSPDKSAFIAKKLLAGSALDYRIVHTDNRGVSAARNTGMELATGQYVIMVDGDDVLVPDFLSVYDRLIRDYPDGDIYSTSFVIYKEDRVIEQPKLGNNTVVYSPTDALVAFFHRSPRFLLPTLMFSNHYLEQNHLRFDEQVRYSEDVQFIWRALAFNNKQLIHSTYSGYKYILHPGSTMTASGVSKIMTWSKGFEQLDHEIHSRLPDVIRDSFVPLSYFSMLHGVSKMLSFSSFKEVYEKTGCAKYLCFKGVQVSIKVKVVAKLTRFCPYLGYCIMKRR